MKTIVITILILIGLFQVSCKKEKEYCWDCGINYGSSIPISYDTICDKTEEEINQWMKEQMQVPGNTQPVVWCDRIN